MEMPPISRLGSLLWFIGSYHTPIAAPKPLILHEPLKAYNISAPLGHLPRLIPSLEERFSWSIYVRGVDSLFSREEL
jgi:hypothetical protein